MAATKWTFALVMIATTAIIGVAQQRDSVKISLDFPVPAWPANGVIPPELKNRYVFVDVAKNQYVVAFPENLGSPEFDKQGPAERRVMRYPLQRDVEPSVVVAVTSVAGKYKYAYTLFNGPKAKESLDQWALVLPEVAASSTVKNPAGWFGVVQRGRKFEVAQPSWIQTGSAAVFSFEKPDGQIKPGSLKSGFEVESELKPGFSVGFFRQTESVDATVQASGNIPQIVTKNATPPPPPGAAPGGGGGGGGFGGNQAPTGATTAWQPIKDDIDRLLRFEYNSKTLLTLAPKFDKAATDKTIATDFMQGITALSQTGVLAADSPFVKGILGDLDGYIKAGASGQIRPTVQPRNEVETAIFNAMKLSLHIN